VAQEKVVTTNPKKIVADSEIEIFYILKSSTDDFFKETAASLKKSKNVNVQFSNIKRNSNNEIVRIRIVVDNNKGTKSEHQVDSDQPIEDIVFSYVALKNGKSEIGFNPRTSANMIKILSTGISTVKKESTKEAEDSEIEVANSENSAVEIEMPSPPSPPSPPKHGYNNNQPKFYAPKPPRTPRNMQDPKVAADYEQQMRAFEKQMDATSKKFDEEMEKFMANQDKKMEEYNKQMNEYDKKMNEYDQKINEYHNKMETYSEGTSIQKAADIEKRRNDVRRKREMIKEKRQQIQSR
jgi:uncharacterized coiled-coil protein SlyX